MRSNYILLMNTANLILYQTGSEANLPSLAYLFNEYRIFYGQKSDLTDVTLFIGERLKQKDSVIYFAMQGDTPAGFVQLYPSFSSVSMRRIWILNDLFVNKAFRRLGIAQHLMNMAKDLALNTQAKRLSLSTQKDNVTAKSVYDSLQYKQDMVFDHYSLEFK